MPGVLESMCRCDAGSQFVVRGLSRLPSVWLHKGNLTSAYLGQISLHDAPTLTVGLVNVSLVSSVRKSQCMSEGPKLSDTL